MARFVCSVLIFIAYIIVSFVSITSLTSGREIPSKKLGYNITPFIIHLQQRKIEDHNNEEKTVYTLNRNRRTIGSAITNTRALLGRIFNSIFQRENVDIDYLYYTPPAHTHYRPITTDELPIPTHRPISATDIPTLPTTVRPVPTNRRPQSIDTSGSGNRKIPQAPFVSEFGGLTVIPAPDLTKVPEPNFLKQSAFPGNLL